MLGASSSASLGRQTWALARKNLIIAVRRHSSATVFRAFLLPVIFTAFIAYARNLFVTPAVYGIGHAAPLNNLADELHRNGHQLVLVNSGLGGEVDTLIENIAAPLRARGSVKILTHDTDLQVECKQSLQGVSHCYAAVVFISSPKQGSGGRWNYTLRGDTTLSLGRVDVTDHRNDVETRMLPLQFAVDTAIAQLENPGTAQPAVQEYMFTSESQKERDDDIRRKYMSAITGYISAALFLGMVGIIYQLSGFMATERERGLSTLVEAMGGSKASRLLSYHLAYSMIYLPSWIVMAFILYGGVFHRTSVAILLIYHILFGLNIAGWGIFLGSVFKRAQLSGISTTIVSIGLAIIAQVLNNSNAAAFAILGLLFPPCNYVFFFITMGRWEKESMGTNLVKSPPSGNSSLPAIALWIFTIVQMIVFPFLAALVERYLFSTESRGHRHIDAPEMDPMSAIELRGFTKEYPPNWLMRRFGGDKSSVVAVNSLDLKVLKGQILVLLGANGSGKTTTLEAITGLGSVSNGDIHISTGGNGGVGICPQKNVLWDDLSVEEHVDIWNKVKCTGESKQALKQLVENCDLTPKRRALSKNLSGGQKRKLQLAAMFVGGSKVCAVDEITSGLDPLSRRKIWDIILGARGDRTFVLTTHFLDEADLLADHIAILSKGHLKCEGSAVELKAKLGGGYRVHVPGTGPTLEDVPTKNFYDETIYNIPDSAAASRVIAALERVEVADYHVAGPTIEDVFLKVAEETIIKRVTTAKSERNGQPNEKAPAIEEASSQGDGEDKGVNLKDGRRISIAQQTKVMLLKRFTILKRNWFPYLAAIVIPIVAGGITMVVLKDFNKVTCSQAINNRIGDISRFDFTPTFNFAVGPPDLFSSVAIARLEQVLLPNTTAANTGGTQNLTKALHYVDTLSDFNQYIDDNYHNVTPGGLFLGNGNATYAFQGDGDIHLALAMQNIVDNLLFNVSGGISTQYMQLDMNIPQGTGKTLIFIVYTGLAMAAFPAFFALYPTVERLRNVRALHYSNGVRALPLWLAYTAFDFISVLIISTVVMIIWAAATSGWYNLGYLFAVLMLYGLAAMQLVYVVSLVCRSQLAAFAFAAGGQASLFLIYIIVYLSVLTFAQPDNTTTMLNTMHFVFAAFAPIASVIRSFFVALNTFSVDCRGDNLASYAGGITLYGGPILYLLVQSLVLFAFLVAYDSGRLSFRLPSMLSRAPPPPTVEESPTFSAAELAAEESRVAAAGNDDNLRVLALSKRFGRSWAVNNITFGVPSSSVFALLGPNGAGKTTTLNMVRGVLPASDGDALLRGTSISRHRAAARAHLGVCPQFDAMDRMTVAEHLRFYAQVRGVDDVAHNVREVIRAVGLDEYAGRIASKLSGGNKRKLSLAIALMGNPAVLLLDEPSSGMDAAAKRVMWRTLKAVTPGRALVLTTHSMEEADALATRAGIVASRMLALGTTAELRRRYGDRYLVHLALAPASPSSESLPLPVTPKEAETETEKEAAEADEPRLAAVKAWVLETFAGAEVERRSFHGQLRFSVPANAQGGSVSALFDTLERQAPAFGVRFWSVGHATMDMVFLNIVGQAHVQEEGYEQRKRRWWEWNRGR